MAKSDHLIRQRVQETLDSNVETRVYGLRADVINGEVQLTGIVDTLSEKEAPVALFQGSKG